MIRIYKTENYAEFEWSVGPLPKGIELITRFDTDIESNGVFYTDSNGREMIKRQRDYRETWKLQLDEKIAGNYYPVTSKIAIEDDTRRFAILTDRSEGGSSLKDGSIELMVDFLCNFSLIYESYFRFIAFIFQLHRRPLHDDSFGVGEVLDEPSFDRKGLIVRGTSYFVFGSKILTDNPSAYANERFIQQRVLLPSWLFFSNVNSLSYSVWKNSFKNTVSSCIFLNYLYFRSFLFEKSNQVAISFQKISPLFIFSISVLWLIVIPT